MFDAQGQNHILFYEIQVSGRIDPQRGAWFGNMAIQVSHLEDGSVITALSGALPDQAALHGLLAKIRDLNLNLISVARKMEKE